MKVVLITVVIQATDTDSEDTPRKKTIHYDGTAWFVSSEKGAAPIWPRDAKLMVALDQLRKDY
jgi:hypothetical protein